MRNIDRLCWLGLWLILGSFFLPFNTFAQEPFPWQSNLENAQRLAAQNNRLVFIHFWATWCGACNRMEAEVFNQPGVAAAITANYVPVKINADQMPSTAKQYGITALPTEVIITPQGQVVDSIRGRSEATQFVVRLNQIASARQQITGQMAQMPANIPARPADRSIAEQSTANNLPAARNSLSDDRYADYYRRNSPDQREQPSLSAQAASREPVQSSPATVSPPYARQQPVSGPESLSPGADQLPGSSASAVQNITPPPTPGSTPQSMTNQPQQALSNQPQQTLPEANQLLQSPAPNTAQQAPPASNPFLPPPAANTAQQIPPPSTPSLPSATNAPQQTPADPNLTSPPFGTSAAQQIPAASTPSSPPAANPPLCLDGYCPVCLAEKQQWLPGDRRFGAIHRGRTYLFAGADQQRSFFRDPDRYAPMISGNDIVQAMEKGQTIAGKREHGVYYNNHIFLFADEITLDKFSKNPAYYASQALEAIQASNHTSQQLR